MASYKTKQILENSQQKMQKKLVVLLSSLKKKKKTKTNQKQKEKQKYLLLKVTSGYCKTLFTFLLSSTVRAVINSSPVLL